MSAELTDRLAELAVRFGANVQPGQIVSISGEPGKEAMVRAVARAAYRAGAKYVDAAYWDPHVKRARLELADPETLDYVPPWLGQKVLALGEQRAARIAMSGPVEPNLFEGIDPALIGRDQTPMVKESGKVVNDRTTNWTIVPFPTAGWAHLVHPELEAGEALAKLWEEVAHICRLDEDDPVASWGTRMATLDAAATKLNERRFSALRFEGPGTDLTVGLLPGSRWLTAGTFTTIDGLRHMANIPSEETFTTPDPARTEGVMTCTKPAVMRDGTVVEGLVVRFEGGRAVQVDADRNAEAYRALLARDDGAARLGEVALVDREGRIGPMDRVFFDTLIDENAASHVALGNAYTFAVDDEEGRSAANDSAIHEDVMIGSDAVAVTGVTDGGEEIPVLRDGAWAL